MNKKFDLKYILLCVFAGLVLAVGAAIRTVYGSDVIVAYEHDKLYHEFKKTYDIKNIDIEVSADKYGTVLVENDNFTAKYYCDEDGDLSFSIVDKKTGEIYGSRSEIYGVNSAGEIVCIYAVHGGNRYYDPYAKDFEYGIRFVDYNEEKVVIEALLLQDFFWENPYFKYARFMTVEEFEELEESLDSDGQFKWSHLYGLNTYEDMNYSDCLKIANEYGVIFPWLDETMFSEPFYLGRSLSVRVDEFIESTGYTVEDKRRQESKFIKNGYEAPMALARFTIDISGEELTYDAELVEVISPRKSDVVDILVPKDPMISIDNYQLVKEGRNSKLSENAGNVLNSIDRNYAKYPVDFELTVSPGKVDCELLLNESFGFGDMNIFIFDYENRSNVIFHGTITEGKTLTVELPEAEYSATGYNILLYNEDYIYEFQLSLKRSADDSLSVSKKNIFYNEIGEVSFEAYKAFTSEQLADFGKYDEFSWGQYGYASYHETVVGNGHQNLSEGEDLWLLKYFRSDSSDAKYLIEVRTRFYESRYSQKDPCILSVEVCGDTILEPIFMEYGKIYYLTVTRLDDGELSPYALFDYLLY